MEEMQRTRKSANPCVVTAARMKKTTHRQGWVVFRFSSALNYIARHAGSCISLLCILSCLLCACDRNEVPLEEGSKTIDFRITNYKQYELDEGTRATTATSSQALKHLALAVFDASTDKMVGSVQICDSGTDGYGTFSATLPYGHYRLVFLGYGGEKNCIVESPECIYFAPDYVPQTFLCTTVLEVNAQTEVTSDVTLHRVVAGFQLHMEDAIPDNARELRVQTSGSGYVLNAKTGLAASVTGKRTTITIGESLRGQSGKKATMYFFPASTPELMDIDVSALDDQGEEIARRTFPSVPMKANTLTVYKGRFFSGQSYGFTIAVDEEWGETVENPF